MSSSIIPGSIPLPPAPVGDASTSVENGPAVVETNPSMAYMAATTSAINPTSIVGQVPSGGLLATPGAVYDQQTLAYYQAYYQQPPDVQQYQQYYNCFAGGVAAAARAAASQVPITNGTNQVTDDVREDDDEDEDDDPTIDRGQTVKASNVLPVWGNEKTMNLNPLLLTNIQSSPYFKVTLFALKTYHEVIDEIWYNVKHLEPWERGSRKVSQVCICNCHQ